VLDIADKRSLALLFHLNSEPWLNPQGSGAHVYDVQFKEVSGRGPAIALPETADPGRLADLIRRRESCRAYADRPLALADLAPLLAGSFAPSRVLSLAGGVETRARSAPSAGALYPLEVYVVASRVEPLGDGLYHYNVLDHALEPVRPGLGLADLAEAMIAASTLERANAIIFLTAVFDRTLRKYGARGYRYILLEAGHSAQNLCLLATERELATLCLGGFFDSRVNRLLELDPRTEVAVYCVAVGHPA